MSEEEAQDPPDTWSPGSLPPDGNQTQSVYEAESIHGLKTGYPSPEVGWSR